ncbi:SDR family oxidoreductase [Sandaracinobacteroides saxicola]|uniref:SDR family NAD(P)-dependent oxidoreductase n=1 Tax=Sandaracinobacteroides saxicola TaxID=2759707 RepID=A0A7G5IFZ7_9SPHN|nr:SDR family oxidoreductase [Sandaracinobacteroides saxicola]QMW22289.1 SDR family NAD(P)-dependent oxidoreductase [Sandaracinobacteroides saxicola]
MSSIPQPKPLRDQAIVITGASSGIGMATALAAAQQGARVALFARTTTALDEVAQQIRAAGGIVLVRSGDVADRAALEALAEDTFAAFGRIDTWVNNAGVSIYGAMDRISEADLRRLFDTNLFGVINGSLAALPHLKASGGTLINLGSQLADMAVPVQGYYVASKFAVKGFTDALRQELEHDQAPVGVTLIKPAAIGTPFPDHAKNITGRRATLPAPIYSPHDVARTILHAAQTRVRDAYVGGAAPASVAMGRLSPRLADLFSAKVMADTMTGEAAPPPPDNLHHGQSDARLFGKHEEKRIRRSSYTAMRTRPMTTFAVGAMALGALLIGLRKRQTVVA